MAGTDLSIYREIPLTQGKVALVDAADYEWLSVFNWHATSFKRSTGLLVWYAFRGEGPRAHHRHIPMHREILGTPIGVLTDHKDGDGLHNWRDNLRLADKTRNAQNLRHSRAFKTSVYKGVSLFGQNGRWRATIKVTGKQIALGYFDSEEDAAHAYDSAARLYFGEFAAPNFHG